MNRARWIFFSEAPLSRRGSREDCRRSAVNINEDSQGSLLFWFCPSLLDRYNYELWAQGEVCVWVATAVTHTQTRSHTLKLSGDYCPPQKEELSSCLEVHQAIPETQMSIPVYEKCLFECKMK